MRLNKKILTAGLIGIMSLSMSVPAFALGWTKGISRNAWWYDLGNGNYHKSSWQWIDGNRDGIAECYCFDNDGWMYENTKTPDGYDVNADGAWVVNGVVQTKRVSKSNGPGGSSSSSSGTSSGSSRVSSGGSSSRGSSSSSSSTNKTRISRTLVEENGVWYYVSRYSDGSVEKEETRLKTDEELAKENGTYVDESKIEEYQDEVIRLINEYRMQNGLNALEKDDRLMEIAKIRAEEQVIKKGHVRPNGELYLSLFQERNFVYGGGEVIHILGNPISALNGWKKSYSHNKLLLDEEFSMIGVGVFNKNNKNYYVVNFYNE